MMLLIIIAGFISAFTIQKEVFPNFETNTIQVSVPYLGAAPEEVEEGVILRIEEAVQDIKGIKKMASTAFEGLANVNLEIESEYELSDVLDEVKGRVDAISTFPEQTEKPIIEKLEFERDVIWISVYGDMDPRARKKIANEIRDELLTLRDISLVEILGDRDYEISIEVSEETLRKYSLTMDEVASAIRASSMDMPGGTIKSEVGDILLKTKGQMYTGQEYSNIALRSNVDGTRLLLGDIATIRDGFIETEEFSRFNGKPSLSIRVQSTGDQNVLNIDKAVEKYMAEKKASIAPGVYIDSWGSSAFYLKARLSMMLSNLTLGAVLVFLILTVFLRLRVALWVIVGIPVSFLGALWLLPLTPFPVNINLLSLFGFILVLGIVVDDAIIIGESIYTSITEHGHTLDNVIKGANKVAMPATFGVLTTIAAFLPMLFIGGQIGPFFETIGMVVILCLTFSLIESKLVLPAHLSRIKYVPENERSDNYLSRFQSFIANGLQQFIKNRYSPLLVKAIDKRYTTAALFLAGLILILGMIAGGLIKFEFFPNVPSDFIQGNITMNEGSPAASRNAALLSLKEAVDAVETEYLKENPTEEKLLEYVLEFTDGNLSGTIVIELTKAEYRQIDAYEVEKRWRAKVGEIAGAKELRFFASTNSGGGAKINFQFSGNDFDRMNDAAKALETRLGEYEGIFDIRNSFSSGTQEIQLKIKPEAELLGLNMANLGRQVRQAFYGEEVQRIQRGRDELKIMVRYPRAERHSIADLENMRIRTPNGDEVPFLDVADVSIDSSPAMVSRVDRERTITVTADLDPLKSNSGEVIGEIQKEFMPALLKKYSSVRYSLGGSSQEEEELKVRIAIFFGIALFLIYGLLAIPLHSYLQPIVIMIAIPFGFIGAVCGHVVFGQSINMMSMFGMVALAGVVINDGLILLDFVNKGRDEGLSVKESLRLAGERRFRAILLTTLTTFFGLLPIIFETSLQAQFVIPMAISLGFGILFGTVITLFLVPALYMVLNDMLGRSEVGELQT
ncbi:MAG: MMPL family transporter [Gammaproteobacteria bacterium]|nr:MMPL family transporter [Gammaproteobacteria bacterium]